MVKGMSIYNPDTRVYLTRGSLLSWYRLKEVCPRGRARRQRALPFSSRELATAWITAARARDRCRSGSAHRVACWVLGLETPGTLSGLRTQSDTYAILCADETWTSRSGVERRVPWALIQNSRATATLERSAKHLTSTQRTDVAPILEELALCYSESTEAAARFVRQQSHVYWYATGL